MSIEALAISEEEVFRPTPSSQKYCGYYTDEQKIPVAQEKLRANCGPAMVKGYYCENCPYAVSDPGEPVNIELFNLYYGAEEFKSRFRGTSPSLLEIHIFLKKKARQTLLYTTFRQVLDGSEGRRHTKPLPPQK